MILLKILNYKKSGKGKYIISFDDGRKIPLYEDVILKYNLLLKKEVLDSELDEINKMNFEYDVYYIALNSISNRIKSIYELKTYLIKRSYPDELIEKAIDKLIKQGYLDDRIYTKSYINTQILTTSHGPNRIKKDLVDKRIDLNIIEDELVVFTDEIQEEKINKFINKCIKTNRTRGGLVLKQKIINDLKNNGYDFGIISRVIVNYDFSNDGDIAKKEYEKLYKKYSKKYEGYELKRIIREKLFQKGLVYEEE